MRILLSRTIQLLCVLWAAANGLPVPSVSAQLSLPPVWDIISDDFESGSLHVWQTVAPDSLSLMPGAGRKGSTGLSVIVSPEKAYIYQSHVAYALEGYLTFWLNPNGVALPEPSPNYWPPGSSLRVARIRSSNDEWWPPLVDVVRTPAGRAELSGLPRLAHRRWLFLRLQVCWFCNNKKERSHLWGFSFICTFANVIFFLYINMREFKKPDVKASRYKPEVSTILNKEFFDNFKNTHSST